MSNGCIGPINIIPDNNEVVLQDVNQVITVIDNNCCTAVDITQPTTAVVQILTGPMGLFPTEGPYGFTGSFDISGSLTVTGSIYSDVISSPYFTGSFYGNGSGVFSGSFSGSVTATLQEITDNGSITDHVISASGLDTNALNVLGDVTVTGSLTVSGSNTFKNIGPAQFTGSTDITGSLSINGVDYEFTSASFDTRILNNSASISLLSGSYLTDSGSFSTRVTDLENFSSSLDATFATDAELNAATASLSSSIAYLSGSYLNSSASFDTRTLNNSSSISLLSGSFLNTSSSLSTRVTDLENFSSSLDATFATDAELNAATASLSGSISYLSSSYLISSASFDDRINSINSESLGTGIIVVDLATTQSLRASTYYNGLSNDGIGATLTSNTNGALGTIDGVNTLLNYRILVKNQVTQLQNGPYVLTQTGSSVAPFILTRTLDANETSEFSPQIVVPALGVLNKGLNFAQTTEDPSIGVSNIVYSQITSSNLYVSQVAGGTNAVNQIALYTGTSRQLASGNSGFTYIVSTGTLRVRNVPYIYPSVQGANGTVLMNNGSGTLRWANNFTGSLLGTASWASNAVTASYIQTAQTASYVLNAISSSFAATSSYLNTLNQDLTFNGNLTLNGTASIKYLDVIFESASVIYSSGSNQLGDATDDTQTLVGTVKISGSLQVTGSTNIPSLTGSLLGTASYAINAATASNILGGKATHIPFFITDTTLATSSIYQSGSTSIIINQDANTTANPEALYVWQPSTSSFNVISGKGNLNNYLQLNIQNTNQGVTASSDVVATANNGNELINYIDMGINNENFSGDIGGPNAGYLYSTGQHLHIGNASNFPIQLFAGGFDSDANRKLQLSPNNYHEMTGSLDISGSLIVLDGITGSLNGTASYANNGLSSSYALNADLLDGKDSTVFATTGSNTFIGNQTITGSLNISGSTTQIGNNSLLGNTTLSGSITISGNTVMTGSITATNLTASFGYVSASFLDITGKQTVRGFTQYIPTSDIVPIDVPGGYIYSSGSEGDLYFAQTNGSINNVIRLRWLEGNMYSGLLNGALITTQSSTTYQVSSGSGIIVSLNGSLTTDPYPAVQYINWPNLSASIAPLSASFDQSFVAISPSGSTGTIYTQGTPYDNGQFNTLIPIGNVIHQNRTSINATATYPSVAYGYKQRSSDFVRAFGALKLSGLNTAVSSSSTGSLIVTSGTAYSEGRNYTTDPNNPSYVTDTGTTVSKIFRYYQSGSSWVYLTNGGAGYPTIDPTQYSNNGVLTPVPGTGANREFSIQRVYWFPGGATKGIYVYYGNDTYTTAVEAIANIPYENFIEAPNTAGGAVLSAYLVVRNNADFTDNTSYQIQQGGLFRNIGGSGGGGSAITQTLSGLSDVSISGPTNGQPLVYNSTTTKWQNQSTITATLTGTASYAISASHANTSSYSDTALSSSHALTASYVANASSFPFTGSAIITGSLVVTGSIVSTGGITGSLFGTASWANNSTNAITASYATEALSSSYSISSSFAQTASFLLGSVTSASYAATSSYANDFTIDNKLYLDETLTDRATILSTIVGSNNLYTQATGSYTSAFGKYTLFNGANARAGEFITVWNGTSVTYTDVSTTDIGDTSTIVFSSAVIGSNIEIDAVAGASGWKIKMLTTFI